MSSENHIPDLSPVLARPTEPELELPKIFARNKELTLFDVGACEGEDTIRYSRLFPYSRIYSFEPLPENQALILENFKRYQINNARLIPLALSHRAGMAQFHVSSGSPPRKFLGEQWNYGNKSSSLLPPKDKNPMLGWVEFKKIIGVQCQTLDEFCRLLGIAHIDFIHMDVQGAESLVIQGATQMLYNISTLWLEVSKKELYSGQVLRPEIKKLMGDAGFFLAFETMRAVEGDQFYINGREAWALSYLFRRKAYSFADKVRKLARNAGLKILKAGHLLRA